MRYAIMLLFIFGLAAASSPIFTSPPASPTSLLLDQLDLAMQIVVALMMVMIVAAAAVYVIGQLFGAETRAKATTYAHGLLAAVGVSALILVMLAVLVPAFITGGIPTGDIVNTISQVRGIAEISLVGLIAVLIGLAAVMYTLGQVMGAQTRAKASVWATGLLSGAIVAAIIYVLLFQVLTQFEATLFQGTPLYIYRSVIVNITFFAAFLILITYLLSKVFKVPEWEAYLNIELSNLMASFLIVIFMLGLFGVGTAIASIYSGGTATSPPQAAISYMRTTVADSVLRAIYDVYQIQACTSILSAISRRIGEFVLTQTFKVFPGIDTFVQITNVLGFGLISAYGSISAQIALLYLVDSTMVNFFLPAGLILRFFPPTRDAGAFLISMAFGFHIIYPTTYMINKSIYEEIGATAYKSPYVLISSLCGPFKYGVWGVLLNTQANPIFRIVPGGTVIGGFLSRLVSESLLNAVSMAEFIPIMRHMASLSLLALFMPALSMTITIAFINAMTKFIVAKV
jgi:hypothetical protein